jgi:hypothetical protein
MPVAVLLALAGLVALSWFFGFRARANRTSPLDLWNLTWRQLLWRGFGSRAEYTDIGWRYRNLNLVCFWLAVAVLVGWFLVGSA